MSYIITLAEYKSFLGITSTTHDTQITALIPAIDAEINSYIFGTGVTSQPTLIQKTYTEVFDGTGNSFLRLRGKPLQSITSFTFGYNTSAPLTFTGTNFIFEPQTSMVYFNPAITSGSLPSVFLYGTQNIQAIYVAGYLQADVPQDIKRAAALMTQRIFNLVNPQYLVGSITLDQLTISSGNNMLAISSAMFTDVRYILDRYKDVRFIF